MPYKYEGDVSVSAKVSGCLPHGKGKLTFYEEDGVTVSYTYEGAFDGSRMTGQGRTTQEDTPDDPGWIYEGAHVDGWADGCGIWRRRIDNTMTYEGNFKVSHRVNHYHGQGTSYRHDGEIREDGTREDGTKEYEGQWEESCWRGVGTLYRPDGTISRNGTWVNGGSEEYPRQEGEEMYWYEGDWDVEGCMHGWGILYRPDRTTVEREGWWQNGEPVDGSPAGYPDAP